MPLRILLREASGRAPCAASAVLVAGVAQLAAHLSCNQVVGGSSPPAGSVSSQVSGWLGAADLLLRHARR